MGMSENREKTFIVYLLYVNTTYIVYRLVLTVPLQSWFNHPVHRKGHLGSERFLKVPGQRSQDSNLSLPIS